jgi:hypothetical protein
MVHVELINIYCLLATSANHTQVGALSMAKCPYCHETVTLDRSKQDLGLEVKREIKGFVKKEVMYSCPHCDAILGFGFYIGGWWTGRP